MVSLRASVIALYKENNKITINDLKKIFVDADEKTLGEYLSVVRKTLDGFVDDKNKIKNFSKITESEIEKVIIEKLNQSLDNANIRLAIDFLKIKRSEAGLDDDLDIEKYLKKLNVEDLSLIEE